MILDALSEAHRYIGLHPRFDRAFEFLTRADLEALPPEGREREISRLVAAEALRPFDLERGPLLRSLLLRAAGEDQVALLAMHHIVSDAWSMNVLVREVITLYEAFSRGLPSPRSQRRVDEPPPEDRPLVCVPARPPRRLRSLGRIAARR